MYFIILKTHGTLMVHIREGTSPAGRREVLESVLVLTEVHGGASENKARRSLPKRECQ